jgi:hypothetical protein
MGLLENVGVPVLVAVLVSWLYHELVFRKYPTLEEFGAMERRVARWSKRCLQLIREVVPGRLQAEMSRLEAVARDWNEVHRSGSGTSTMSVAYLPEPYRIVAVASVGENRFQVAEIRYEPGDEDSRDLHFDPFSGDEGGDKQDGELSDLERFVRAMEGAMRQWEFPAESQV